MEMWTPHDQLHMDEALAFANDALKKKEVPVGCVFLYENSIIAVGRNEVNKTKNATRHAEMICIDQVVNYARDNFLSLSIFENIDIYVTVEPCIMCASALYCLNVRSINYGCKNDRFGGESVLNVRNLLKPQHTIIKGGYKAEEAMELLKEFYKGQNPNAPVGKVKKKLNY